MKNDNTMLVFADKYYKVLYGVEILFGIQEMSGNEYYGRNKKLYRFREIGWC